MTFAREEIEAYRECEKIARREGRNFHWGFRFLPQERRAALCALYAFARATDDIVDETRSTVAERAIRIRDWEERLASALAGEPVDDVVLQATAFATRRFSIPVAELRLLIEGCRDDLTIRRYETMGDTLGYCRKVAVTVGMAMLAIFESRDAATRAAMESIGYAFQLTNILRDIPEDLGRDRIYLPLENLRRHGVVEEDLRSGAPSPAVRLLVGEIAALTERYYHDARVLFRTLDPRSAKTMKAMWRIYHGILDEIRRADGDVWSRRPGLSTVKKTAIVVATSIGL